MKKNTKTLTTLLLVLVMTVQLFGAMASAQGVDPGEATLSYKLTAQVDPENSGQLIDQEITGENSDLIGDYAVRLGKTDLTLGVPGSDGATLSQILDGDVIAITVPDGYYVSALALRAADSTETGTSLLPRATASAFSADISLMPEDLIVTENGNKYLDGDIINGATDAANYVLDISLSKLDENETITVDGQSMANAPDAAQAPDYSQFSGWLLSYPNGSRVLVKPGEDLSPYTSCTLQAVFEPVIYTATVSAEDKSMVLGEAAPEYTATVDNAELNLSGFTFTLKKDGEAVSEITAAGTYTIEVSGGTDASIPSENLSLSYVPGTLTVTVPANDTPAEKTDISFTPNAPVYDEASKTFKTDGYTTTGTLAQGDSLVAELEVRTENGKATVYFKDGYKIVNGENDVSDNYIITVAQSTSVNTPIAVTITAKPPVLGADKTSFNADGYTVTDLVDGDKLQDNTPVLTVNTDGSGNYFVVPSAAVIVYSNGDPVPAGKYDITYANSSSVKAETPTVQRGAITIKAKDRSATYDGTEIKANEYEIVAGALAAGDTIESISYTGGSTNVTSTAVDSTPGSVKIVNGSTDVTSQYTITYQAGKVTVNKKDATITINNPEKTYDGNAFSVTTGAKVSTSGLLTGHSAAVSVQVRQNGTAVTATQAGSYDLVITGVKITSSATGDTDLSGNYNLTLNNGKLTIKESSTGIALTITADSQTWTYDGTDHKLETYKITSGALQNGDRISSVTFKSTSTIRNAGTAKNEISQVVIQDSNGNAVASGKYNITLAAGTLTVNKASLTLTAESATKTYDGKALDNRNVAATKLANTNHKLSVTLAITDGKGNTITSGPVNPGTYTKKISAYTIMDGTTDVTANYDVRTVDGTLTINPSSQNNSNSPKTGDESNIGLWIGLLAGSALLIAAVVVFILMKNKKKNAPTDPTEPEFAAEPTDEEAPQDEDFTINIDLEDYSDKPVDDNFDNKDE